MVSLKKFWLEIKEECSKHFFRSHGRLVLVHDEVIMKQFGIPAHVVGAGCFKIITGHQIVVINSAVRASGEDFQAAVILHEIGHIVHDHLLKMAKDPRRTDAMEFEADLYAQQQGANMIGALKHLVSLGKYDNEELFRRIAFLETQ